MQKDNSTSKATGYVDSFKAKNFFSIKEVGMNGLGDRKEIYLLGENGDGKTLVLMSLLIGFKGYFLVHKDQIKETGKIISLITENPSLDIVGSDNNNIKYGIEYQELSNEEKAVIDGDGYLPTVLKKNLDNFLAYGVHRSRNDSEKASKYGFMSLFDGDQYLISPERWLMNLYTKELEKETKKNTASATSISLNTAKAILSDLVEKNVEFEVNSDGVKYIERGTPLRFSQLSEGYKSVITWICDMVARLSEKQPNVEEIKDFQGVVLVDEINLHLHPRWEKQIVKKLRAWFPKIQFFFTTHSPVTILGASDDAVFYRVYKEEEEEEEEEEGKTKISEPYFKENLKDLMANSILTSPLFGLEDARMNGKELSSPSLDTSEDYLHSRIHQKISERLEKEKKSGKVYFSKEEIDALIEQAMDEELA